MRRRLPDTRESITHKFNVAGHEGYLIVGLYEDGSPGELFITMAKEGSTIGGLMDSLGTAISVALQYGVPVESLVTKFAHQRFEPMGMTTNPEIPFAKSLVDYIFRWLGMQFIDGYREKNAPVRSARGDGGSSRPSTTESRSESRPWSAARTEHAPAPDDSRNPAPSSGTPQRPSAARRLQGETEIAPPRDATSRLIVSEQFAGIVETTDADGARRTTVVAAAATSSLDHSNANLMGDAPACDVCGAITVRNGSCYRCLNCGNSMGCS